MTQPYGPNSRLIEEFLTRLQNLPFRDLGRAVQTWRAKVGEEWHHAEDAVGDAIAATDRHEERQRLLERIYHIFRGSTWFSSREPDSLVPGSDASAQYVTSAALFALLVCDALRDGDFATMYAPFAAVIPLPELSTGRSR